ncbi:MAG TPA: hypothetical protein PKA63_06530 [Oligoflexia bacterium]|nr:hypothetical protein [Oligoflexia bacterium]HMP48305.1 hypothetical protein [Oligoflexia bacterium]
MSPSLLQAIISSAILPLLVFFATLSEIKNFLSLSTHHKAQAAIMESLETGTSWQQASKKDLLKKGTEILNELGIGKRYLGGRFKEKYQHGAGKAYVIKAVNSPDSTTMLNNFCKARALFLEATKTNPRNTKYHIEIADIESLSPLLAKSCEDLNIGQLTGLSKPKNLLSAKNRLDHVLNINPSHLNTIYRAGLIYRQLGSRPEALRTFRRFQELSPSQSNRGLTEFFASIPENEQELDLILPRKYPLVLTWAKIYDKDPERSLEEHLPIFEAALKETLENEFSLLTDGRISESLFLETLYHLAEESLLVEFPAIRKKVFSLLKEHYEEKKDSFASSISKDYSTLTRIPTIKALEISRPAPGSGSLSFWINDKDQRTLSLDLKSDTLGLFTPSSRQAKIITITGKRGDQLPDSVSVKIWGSSDNLKFSPYQGVYKIETGSFNAAPVIKIELSEPIGAYTKLYFNSSGTISGRISQTADKLVQVYGK